MNFSAMTAEHFRLMCFLGDRPVSVDSLRDLALGIHDVIRLLKTLSCSDCTYCIRGVIWRCALRIDYLLTQYSLTSLNYYCKTRMRRIVHAMYTSGSFFVPF